MSERILKALMQLFAIISRPQVDGSDRRVIVASFLMQQLNRELVNEYLKVFDEYYAIYQKKQTETKKIKKSISLSSVKVLRICTEINKELTVKQKIVVLFRLLEFIKSDVEEKTEQEMEFVETVADTFHISTDEYNRIKDFVFFPNNTIPVSSEFLLISDKQAPPDKKIKYIFSESLAGQIWVLHLTTANMHVVRYFGENELYLNGQLIRPDKIHILTPGSSLRNSKIKPVYYSDIVSSFILHKHKSKIVFEVNDIEYQFKGGNIGLHKLNFTEETGKLVGIMGASGAGKSTLLNMLNGTYKPSSGKVLINNIDIHEEKEKIHGIIGHVSQDDLLIEELTIYQNLYYNAKLCFGGYSEFQIIRVVSRVLQNLGLYERKDMVVGSPMNKKISGGQRKRLNIALELIREPAVLFLDEPTSGLSSRDSENIMDLLKELTLKGKLVFVVIHQPSSDIFKMFDKMIILDTGGYLIYNGNPVESIVYFKSQIQQADWNDSECRICGNVNPEQIFNIVESHVVDEYGNITNTRKTSPTEWNNQFLNIKPDDVDITNNIPKKIPEINFKIPRKFKQFKVFVIRDVLSKLTNKQYLLINLTEAPILAFLLAFIIKYYSVDVANIFGYTLYDNSNLPVYLFMSVIVAIFIGLTVSAEEIIKDQKILKRESFLNLSRSSYLWSKVVILLVISAIQALTFILVGNSIMEIHGMYFKYWIVLFSTMAFSNLLGLNISDSFKTVITIYILIPFLVIPQLILSGIIVSFDKLNPKISSPSNIPFYGEIMTARWAYEALSVNQFKNNEFEKQFYPYNKVMSIADYKKNYWLRTLSNKIISCQRNIGDDDKKEQVINDLSLLRTEINKEIKNNTKIKFDQLDYLYYNLLNQTAIKSVKDYIDELNKYYIKRYNKANSLKDKLISDLQKTPEKKQEFIMLKKKYQNRSLTEFVCNSNSLDRIIEYKGRLYQKIDPIYHDPEYPFIRAHFYAPQKLLFGKYYDTFWINVFVIWLMVIVLYISLYYRVLKRTLDFFGEINFRKKSIN
ncbi:MAG: ATP-binding cassette domain-containing protein [Bacteroidales bacterium]|nr:ATP-binding cassette domain-containing protein [Bacteroidales bacterium]